MSNISILNDSELIDNIKNNGCSQSFEELVERHSQLYYSVVQKFYIRRKHQLNTQDLQDLLNDLYIVFNNTINKYSINRKTKFSTFLYYMTRFHCLNSHKKFKEEISHENKDIDSINEINNRFYTFQDNMEEINVHVFKILEKMGDKRISKIFKRRFIDVEGNKLTSWNCIANEIGLSVTGTINLYQKGQKFLYQKLHTQKDKI